MTYILLFVCIFPSVDALLSLAWPTSGHPHRSHMVGIPPPSILVFTSTPSRRMSMYAHLGALLVSLTFLLGEMAFPYTSKTVVVLPSIARPTTLLPNPCQSHFLSSYTSPPRHRQPLKLSYHYCCLFLSILSSPPPVLSVFLRSVADVPLPSSLDPAHVAEMWEQARIYRDNKHQRGTAWRCLMAVPRFQTVLLSLNLNAASLYNKLKKECYAKGVRDQYAHDAHLFVQAGKLMASTGGGFFK